MNTEHRLDCECCECLGTEQKEVEHDCWEDSINIGYGLLECQTCHATFDRFGRDE